MWRVLGYRDEKARALKAFDGSYVSITADGATVANATEVGQLEKFQWIDLGENRVALKLKDGPYLSMASNNHIVADSSEIGKSETFNLKYPTNSTLCLETANGKCIAMASDGTLIANGANTTASARFELVNAGYLGEWSILVTYKDQFMLTGFTISEAYGTKLGLFYSANEQQTIRANLLMGYDFLRNSTNHLSNMPSILAGYSDTVSNTSGSFPTSDEAFVTMSNAMLPAVLDSLPNRTLPVILSTEETSKVLEMSQLASVQNVTGSRFSANMTAEPLITTKTLRMNFYNTTSYEALTIEDIIRHIDSWQLSDDAKFSVESLVLAWNSGEHHVTFSGIPDTSNVGGPDWFVSFPVTFESMMLLCRGGVGILAYKALKSLATMGWNAASIARILKTGANAGGFTLWAKMCQKISDAKDGFAGLKGISACKRTMKWLEIAGILIDVGLSFLTAALIADQIGGHLGNSLAASFLIVSVSYSLIYALILYGIGQIPYVGWIISLAITLADIFGGFSDKLMNWLMGLFGPKEDGITEGWLEDVGIPSIGIWDKDVNGLDVGDRITVELNTTSKVNTTGSFDMVQSGWYRPYISIDAPPGSFSNTSATGIPSSSAMNITYGSNWRNERYETGAWIEPGIGMPNFPVNIKLNIYYYLEHKWHHWILFVPCYHTDVRNGHVFFPIHHSLLRCAP